MKIRRNYSTPQSKKFWDHITQIAKEKELETKSLAILKSLNITSNATDFLNLLQDEERLKKVLSLLKLKAFW